MTKKGYNVTNNSFKLKVSNKATVWYP